MKKSELIQKLHERNQTLDVSVVEKSAKFIFDRLSSALVEGDRIEIRGFGTFSLRSLRPHTARNPKTGENIDVGPRFSVYFRSGKLLKERVNNKQKNS